MDPLGRTTAEILALPQLRVQLPCIVLVHALCYRRFSSRASSYFYARPNIIAHYVPFLLSFIWMSTYGTYLWFCDEALADPAFDRVWGAHPKVEAIVVSMLAIQMYDVPVSLVVPDLRQVTFVLHHLIVLVLAWVAMRYRAFYYYGAYFMGVIELSSPLLAVVDAMRDFPKLADDYPMTNEACRVAFGVTFVAVRVVGWCPVSVMFWRDCLGLFEAGAALHGMPLWVPKFWLATHAALTVLQLWWASLIVRAVWAMATGDTEYRLNEAKQA